MAETDTQTNDGLIPLIIAVTGHRDPCAEALPTLRRSVERILDWLGAAGGPIVVLSALAQGADQLVAEVALERGCQLVVPLPMPVAIYREQFEDEASAVAFDALLARASHHYVLETAADLSAADLAGDPQMGGRLYRALACELAQLGHVMLALWDGLPGKVGGTGDAVAIRLGGNPASRDSEDPYRLVAGSGPVWAVVTPRIACERPAMGEAGALLEVRSVGADDGRVDARALVGESADFSKPILAYNEQATRLLRDDRDAVVRSIRGLGVLSFSDEVLAERTGESLTTRIAAGLGDDSTRSDDPVRRVTTSFARTIVRFAVADALAQQHQQRARRLAVGRLGMVLVGLMAFELTTGPGGLSAIMLMGYLVVVVAGVWGCRGLWHRADRAFLECRTLAEHERVRVSMIVAGIKTAAAMRSPLTDDIEEGLLGCAMRLWRLEARLGVVPAEVGLTDRGLRLVHEHWIGAQRAYFERAIVREHKAQRVWARIARAAVGGGLVITVGVIGALAIVGDQSGWWTGENWALLGVVWLLILAAMVRAYMSYRAFDEHINRYDAMRSRFARAKTAVDALLGDPGDALSDTDRARVAGIIEALADEALRENIAWHVLHRERPVEVEAG